MGQFRTTADYVDAVLNRAGETTSGSSPFEADALTYLNKIHHGLIAGGLVFNVDVDDDWPWARARHPFTLKLEAPVTGSATVTNGSDAITFSSGPAASLERWYIRFSGEKTIYPLASHTAASTSAQLESHYLGTTGTKSYEAFKLDYDLISTHIHVGDWNNKLQFGYSGSTVVTVTLTHGAYTPSELAAHIQTLLNSNGGGTAAYTCTYSSITRKFTLTSDRAGGAVFILYGASTSAHVSIWPYVGFDYETKTNSDSHESVYSYGGVSRIISPARVYTSNSQNGRVSMLDHRMLEEDFPLSYAQKRVPRNFAIIRESGDGLLTIRLDAYPNEEMKLEIEVIKVPLDLKDNTASIPLVPRKFSDILEYGAAYFLLLDKEDSKADSYLKLAQVQLKLMQNQYRSTLKSADPYFGEIVARPEKMANRRLRYGYDKNEG